MKKAAVFLATLVLSLGSNLLLLVPKSYAVPTTTSITLTPSTDDPEFNPGTAVTSTVLLTYWHLVVRPPVLPQAHLLNFLLGE